MKTDWNLDDLMEAVLKMPDEPTLVGIACSPTAESWIKAKAVVDSKIPSWFGVRYLIDPRMTSDHVEAYYDQVAWQARCREQTAWEYSPK